MKPVVRNVTGQYIPVHKMLCALHANTDIVTEAAKIPVSNGDSLQTFSDGKYWNSHPLRNENVIVLRLYGDDFEPANPLGPHKTLYKVCCVYYQFENLPVALQSKTENIFMALCYHSDDVKAFGWHAVFKPLVDELKSLEINGIDLAVNGLLLNFKVVLSYVTGDNLFLNGLLGFVESFTANHPYRHCTLHRTAFKDFLYESIATVRTIDSVNEAVSNVNVSDTGIKGGCVLNDLKYFNTATNYVQDITHDLLEGVCVYDL